MAWMHWQKDVVTFTAMVAVEFAGVGVNTLLKAATLKGMSYFVFAFYPYCIGAFVLLPFLFIFPSRVALPPRKFPLIIRICLIGPIGAMAQLSGVKGIYYGSPTLASAMCNLTPAFTFILAIILRMESLDIKSSTTKAKIIGTLVSISGALVVVLYKGPALLSTSSTTVPALSLLSTSQSNWVLGGIFLANQWFLYSVWYIILGQIMLIYPAELTVVFIYNFSAATVSGLVCLIAERNPSAWRLNSEVAYAAVIYTGILGQVFTPGLHTWGARIKGPVYVASFKPVSIAIAAIVAFMFLGDAFYLGSVVGTIIISIGFYAVLWGKAKEENAEENSFSGMASSSSHGKMPLLQFHETEGE